MPQKHDQDDGIHRGFTTAEVSSPDRSDIHTGVTGPPEIKKLIDEISERKTVSSNPRGRRNPPARTATKNVFDDLDDQPID